MDSFLSTYILLLSNFKISLLANLQISLNQLLSISPTSSNYNFYVSEFKGHLNKIIPICIETLLPINTPNNIFELLEYFHVLKPYWSNIFIKQELFKSCQHLISNLTVLVKSYLNEILNMYNKNYVGTQIDLIYKTKNISTRSGSMFFNEILMQKLQIIEGDMEWIYGADWKLKEEFNLYTSLYKKIVNGNNFSNKTEFNENNSILSLLVIKNKKRLFANIGDVEYNNNNDMEVMRYHSRKSGKILNCAFSYRNLYKMLQIYICNFYNYMMNITPYQKILIHDLYKVIMELLLDIYKNHVIWSNTSKLNELNETLYNFNIYTLKLDTYIKYIEYKLQELKTCEYDTNTMNNILTELYVYIGKIDGILLSKHFIVYMNELIYEILKNRLNYSLNQWLNEVELSLDDSNKISKYINITIQIINTKISIVPSLSEVYNKLINILNCNINVIAKLPKLSINQKRKTFKKINREISTEVFTKIFRIYLIIIGKLQENINTLKTYEVFYNVTITEISQYLRDNIEKYNELFEYIVNCKNQFKNKTIRISLFSISLLPLYSSLNSQVISLLNEISKIFMKLYENQLKELRQLMQESMERYYSVINNELTLMTYYNVYSLYSKNTTCYNQINNKFNLLSKSYNLLTDNNYKNVTNISSIEDLLNSVKYSIENMDVYLKNNNEKIVPKLTELSVGISKKYTELLEDYNCILQSTNILNSEIINEIEEKCNELESEINISRILSPILIANTNEGGINKSEILVKEIKNFKNIYSVLLPLHNKISSFNKLIFINISFENVYNELVEMEKELLNINSSNALIASIKTNIKETIRITKFFTPLSVQSINVLQWKYFISKCTSISHDLSEITLKEIIDSRISSDSILQYIQCVQQEEKLLEVYNRIKEKYHSINIKIETVPYTKIDFTPEIEIMEQDLYIFMSLIKTSYISINNDEITNYKESLQLIYNLFQLWNEVQYKWISLNEILSKSDQLQIILKTEYKSFVNWTLQFHKLYEASFFTYNNIIQSYENINLKLNSLLNNFKSIEILLTNYLNQQRAEFPRFYFMKDKNLFDLYSNIVLNQKYLYQMFNSIYSIDIREKANSFVFQSFSDNNGNETINFIPEIEITNGTSIIKQLELTEINMKVTLIRLLCEILKKYNIESLNDNMNWISMIQEYPNQILILFFNIIFKEQIEEIFSLSNIKQNLEEMKKIINSFILHCSSNLFNVKNRRDHLVYELIILLLISQKDLLDKLLLLSNPTISSFIYFIQIHYNFKYTKSNEIINPLSVSIGYNNYEYSFEYISNFPNLIHTPLNENCYLTWSIALSSGYGGSSTGPAGIGKTEMIKELSYILGRYNRTYNCDKSFTYKSLYNIIIGICNIGAWICLDEFNRLEETVLSSISEIIQQVQQSIHNKTYEIIYKKENIKIHYNTALFITYNPTYISRSSLPMNIYNLFRSYDIEKPDISCIVQGLWYKYGFIETNQLAALLLKMCNLYELFTASSYKIKCTVRMYKSIIDLCYSLKCTEENNDEISLLYQSIQIIFYPLLMPIEIEWFNNMMKSKTVFKNRHFPSKKDRR